MSFISTQLARNYVFREQEQEKEGVATTIRPPSTALFCVDSDDRYKTYSERRTATSYPFSFSITKNEALLNGFFSRLALSEFRLNWTLPNISQAWGNNTLTINSGGTNYVFTLPDGFYDAGTIASVLQDLVQAGSSTPSSAGVLPTFIAQQTNEGYIAFASGGVQTFFFPAPTANVRTLYDMLNLNTTAPATSQQGGIVSLRATDFIDVVCSQLTYNQEVKDGSSAPTTRDMLTRIYLDESVPSSFRANTNVFTPPSAPAPTSTNIPQTDPTQRINGSTPFVIYRQFPFPKQVKWEHSQSIGNLVFELYDDQGRSLQDLWTSAYAPSSVLGRFYANPFIWNFTMLVTEN